MLDTNICSYIMRKKPPEVLYEMTKKVEANNSIVISAVTYAEMRFGAIGKKPVPSTVKLSMLLWNVLTMFVLGTKPQ